MHTQYCARIILFYFQAVEESEAGGRNHEGSRARQNHIGQGVFLHWSPEAEEAVKDLAAADDSRLVVLVGW